MSTGPNIVTEYGDAFWWMGQMEHLGDGDIQIITNHFLLRVRRENDNVALIRVLADIGKYISSEQVIHLVNVLLFKRLSNSSKVGGAASQVLHDEYLAMDEDTQSRVMRHLDKLHKRFLEEGNERYATTLAKVKEYLQIPF